MRSKNSPGNPLVSGTAILPNMMIKASVEKTGALEAIPPNSDR
jgi:hypothetical protein